MNKVYNWKRALPGRKAVFLLVFLIVSFFSYSQTVITQWNFNGTSATTIPGGINSPGPSTGTGAASAVVLTGPLSFSSGVANGGSSDPVITSPPNFGWQTTGYTAQGAGNKTAGIQFSVSTVGKQNIVIRYDVRHSNTSSRYEQFQYSTNGTTYTDFGAPFDGNAGDTWFNIRTIDLSSITAVNNNANFAFRIVSTFAPSTSAYAPSNSASTYAAGGTWRFDMATVSGSDIAATPTVNLSVNPNAGSETGTTIITVTATASGNVTGPQTVDLGVSGTNITGGDYTLSGTTITIPDGSTTGSVTFTIQDDILVEGNETAILTISNPSSGITLGGTITQSIDIADNDVALPTVNLSVSANAGSEATMTNITVTATASAPASGNQTVLLNVTGAGITASDYFLPTPLPVTITILNGQTTGNVTFTIRNDAETESDETAVLTISSPSAGITLGTTTTQNITIADNTCQPLIRKSTASSTNGAEISAFDPSTNRVFTVAGPSMEYYSLSNAGILSAPTNMPFGFTVPGGMNVLPNSVAVRNGIVAVSYAVVDAVSLAQQPGRVAFYQASTAAYIHHVIVGYLPDMVVFTPDGTKVLTANEAEPNSYGQGNSFDPEGSVSIIDISGGILAATVTPALFTSFIGQETALRSAGVRIYGPGANAAQDFEPEYIAFSADGTKAFVTLQENNAVAELDIATATFLQILPLGLKDHNLPGKGFDASDRDLSPGFSTGTINIQNWPVYGMYQPDAIASFTVSGITYYITANEGDSRAWTGFNEEIRVGAGGYGLDLGVFPNATTLKLNQNLGRLQLTNATGNTDGDPEFEQIHALGARSFSIWNSTFTQVYDSGDDLEEISADQNPASFNSDGTPSSFDARSDNKGPEPEAVTTGTVNGVLYAFVGTERTGDIYVYDISNPVTPVFKQYIDHPADQGVEGLIFVPANQSPTGKALVISTAEVSRTVTVYEFSAFSEALVTTNAIINQTQGTVNSYGDCSGVIFTLAQSGASPVSGNVTAKVWIEVAQPAEFVKRHYEAVPATNPALSTGRVTLYFTQAEFDDFNAVSNVDLPINSADASGKGNLLVEKRGGTSSDGTGLPNTYPGPVETINPIDADIVWNAAANRWEVSFEVSGFSGFFVKTLSGVLPVQWLTVNGNLNSQKQAVISWKVQENNIAGYEIEKSTDGIHFNKITGISSNGDGQNSYQLTESTILSGTAYYRIKQIDLSGRFGYSQVIRLSTSTTGLITVYPNPASNNMVITVQSGLQKTTARLTDLNGRVLHYIQLNGQSAVVDISSYPKGVYLLRFENGTTKKIVKQ